jgi:murein DD-endopeptidase MepM/ murein hydrolase activator NlpD
MKLKIIPPLRGQDSQGSGAFGASRGSRTHNGIDIACMKGSQVLSVCAGKVTKLGYPYNPNDEKKGHLRYVQVTDKDGNDVRYFYVKPSVKVGDTVLSDWIIGEVQGLTDIYEGITDHYHFEVKKDGAIINPHDYLGE